jgi:hypothetical protein
MYHPRPKLKQELELVEQDCNEYHRLSSESTCNISNHEPCFRSCLFPMYPINLWTQQLVLRAQVYREKWIDAQRSGFGCLFDSIPSIQSCEHLI